MTVSKEDEYRHPVPEGAEDRLFGDTIWVSVVDPKANVFGINHFHLTMKGYARIQAVYVIDGVQQAYGNKIPLEAVADQGPWSDGVLSYEVVDPLEHLRITMDGPAFGFDLDITGRFPVFDYADSQEGDPLRTATPFHGGHYEQGLACKGQFEIRGGPAKGEVRDIDCWGHRDHTWSDRYSDTPEWHDRLRTMFRFTSGPRSSCPIATSTASDWIPADFKPPVSWSSAPGEASSPTPRRQPPIQNIFAADRAQHRSDECRDPRAPLRDHHGRRRGPPRAQHAQPRHSSSSGSAPRTTSRIDSTATRASSTSRSRRRAR